MRLEEERFTPFLSDVTFTSMEEYCRREVEPMGKECEQVGIVPFLILDDLFFFIRCKHYFVLYHE